MSTNNLRRNTFLSTIGLAAVGWLGLKSTSATKVVGPNGLHGALNDNTRVCPDPRSVPCSKRKL